MPDPTGPVFFDSSGKRSALVSTIKATTYFLAAFLVTFLLVTVIVAPILPALKLPNRPSEFGPAFRPFEKAEAAEPTLKWVRSRYANPLAAGGVKRYAFFANWDDKSFSSLKRHHEDLDVLMPTWLHLDGSKGAITHDDPVKEGMILEWIYGASGSSDGEIAVSRRSVLSWLRGHAPSLAVMPVVDNFNPETDRWEGTAADALLASGVSRTQLIESLTSYVEDRRLAGLVLDFEQISWAQKSNFLAFVNDLAQRLHGLGKQLLVNIAADGVAYAKGLAATEADYVLLSAFDEHSDEAGPLAGQGWFESVLDRAFADIDDSRLIVTLGSYAYDWSERGTQEEISVAEAWNRAHEAGAGINFEADSLNPTFSYTSVSEGALHEVWLLDGVTVWNQEGAALAMNPGGIALYRLGAEDESIWDIFARGRSPDPERLDTLKNLKPGPSIVYRGQGEVLRVTSLEEPGVRSLEYDVASNLITDEDMTVLPQPTTITRWGLRHDKVIALTFDDGPLEAYTPAILDVLAEKSVKATFFVIGQNAVLKPELLRRIYDEGHDVGNHTFSHPNIALLPAKQVGMELTATQRVLEAKLGAQTILWRPPFTEDMEPIAADDAYSLIEAGRLGYTTIGLHVDPYDWFRPGTEEIVRRTVSSVEEGQGNVVLLHDGGGNRQQTVDALPQIIDQLRSNGYRFVTVHELLGLRRGDVMPAIPVTELWASNVNDVAFSVWRRANTILRILFIVGIVLGTLRLLPIVIGAVMQSRRAHRRDDNDWRPQRFAVLIPAFNERKVICKSINALLNSPVKNFDIILVDDGSTDDTAAVARAAFASNKRVRVYKKANGGKASALNFALRHTRADVVVTQDADTLFEPDALPLLLRHFREPTVGAVAGTTLVGNRVSWVAQFQALEYVTSQNLDRRALEMANAIPVVPGAIGAWRRLAIRAIGGFAADTLAEDADATIHIERAGWRVLYEPRAMARTEAPETLRNFFKQRFRWMFGMLQAAFKHRHVYREHGAHGVKLFTLPNIFLFQFLFPLVSPVMDLVLLWTLFAAIWGQTMHEASGLSPGVIEVFIFWAAFQALELTVAAIALWLDQRGGWWHLLPLVVVQRFCYRQLLYWVAIRSTGAAVRGRLVSWSKLLRTGRVEALHDSPSSSAIRVRISQEAA